MSISFTCQCGKKLKVADEHAGKRSRCPACAQPVTVPALEAVIAPATHPEPAQDTTTSAEDEAFRALSEGPEPVSSNHDWREVDSRSTPPAPPRLAAAYPARQVEAAPPPKKTRPTKTKYRDPCAPRERRWVIDWGKMGGGLIVVIFGSLLLIGGLSVNQFFIWSPIIIIGGLISMIGGLFGESDD